MQALVEFIESFQPGYASTIVGADDWEIDDLEELAGPLPGAYRRFLRAFGTTLGALSLRGANFCLEDVRATYRALPWLADARFVTIAHCEDFSNTNYFLDRAQPHGDDAMVVQLPLEVGFARQQPWVISIGLEEFLYLEAFRTLRLPGFGHRLELVASTNPARVGVEHAMALFQGLGFARIGPLRHSALYERGDAAIALYCHPQQHVWSFQIGCEDENALTGMTETFIRTLAVERSPFDPPVPVSS